MLHRILTICFCICVLAGPLSAQTSLTVKVDKQGAPIQPTMWGIFFEDINFAADGGLYAEMVKNRSFEFAHPMMGWKEQKVERFSLNKQSGTTAIIRHQPDAASGPRFARVTVNAAGYGLTNEGFRGMGVKQGLKYNFSIRARQQDGDVTLKVVLVDENGKDIGSASVKPSASDWKEYTAEITSSATVAKAKLDILFEGKGVVDIDMVSLFPQNTWKNRPKGMRADLVQLLADLKPGFLRFPGGCIVEGRDLASRYQWKKTVGKIEDRELLINRWNTEFSHRQTPDYFQTFGLGFFEYFQLSEDIGAAPLPILGCGMACQFNTAELVPLDQLDPYVQDALDLIEFANGPVTSTWGKLRADMGHPAPFNMKYIGVGNEQWGPEYIERYKIFAKKIKEKYPDIVIVSSVGPFPDGELFDYAWDELKILDAEIVDEHYYKDPQWFLENSTRYDNYDRNGPKIFAGEYAAQSVATVSPDNKNNWKCALSEAAFMTGLERNADIVHMSSYAPLMAHTDGWQWTPDLIWFDNLRSYGTPNYYVQKLFANYKGTHILSVTDGKENLTGQNGLYASAVLDQNTKEVIVKLVNASGEALATRIDLAGAKGVSTKATLIEMQSDDLDAVNSLDKPRWISPIEKEISLKGRTLSLTLPKQSVSVVKIKMR